MFSVKCESLNEGICSGCLSADRKLKSLSQENSKLLFSLMDYHVIDEAKISTVSLCWECLALLKKIELFQCRVKTAQFHLGYLVTTQTSLTTLGTSRKDIFDAVIQHDVINTDVKSDISTDIPIKEETPVKQETSFIDYDYDDTAFNEIYEESVPKEKIIKKVKTEKNIKKTYYNVRGKYRSKAVLISNNINVSKVDQYFTVLTEKEIQAVIEKDTKTTSSKNDFKCEMCAVGFRKKHVLERHFRVVHKKLSEQTEVLKCIFCGCICLNASKAESHVMAHHKNRYMCKPCNKEYICIRDFTNHYAQLHARFKCDQCEKEYSKKKSLEKHIRIHHSEPICYICNRRYHSYEALQKHRARTHAKIAVKSELAYCVECDKQFPSVYKFKCHLAHSTTHTQPKRTSVPCPECGKIFSRKTYMNNHYRLLHVKRTKHHCQICDKYFVTNSCLRKHKTHVHDKILMPRTKVCEVCGRGFTTNRVLRHHMRTHTGERPHLCPHCSASFAQRTALLTHIKGQHKMIN